VAEPGGALDEGSGVGKMVVEVIVDAPEAACDVQWRRWVLV
jgi:hypothetical protein